MIKKLLVSILTIAFALSTISILTACTGNEGAETGANPIIKQEVSTESIPADDGNLLMLMDYGTISVETDNDTLKDSVAGWSAAYNNDFINSNKLDIDSVEETYGDFEPLHMEELFGTDKGVYEYRSSLLYNPDESYINVPAGRTDNNVLSFAMFQQSEMTGAAHGYYALDGINFDAESGELITLGTLEAANKGFKAAAKAAICDELNKQDIALVLGTAEESVDEDWNEQTTHFMFTDEGITFWYNPYDIASYADGIVCANVPYDVIGDYIDEKYIK